MIKAQSLDAESGAVRFVRGRLALARQDYAQAVMHLEAALARGPQATKIHYPLALAYRGLGDRRKAEEHLALRGEVDLPPIDPILEGLGNLLENAAAYETRGSKAIEARQWPEAVADLQKALSLEPDDALTHLNLGFWSEPACCPGHRPFRPAIPYRPAGWPPCRSCSGSP